MERQSGAPRRWAIAAGILSTLQAGGYLALAITALALYYCEIVPASRKDEPAGFLVYLTYFYNPDSKCRANLGTEYTWPDNEFPTAILTWQWAIAYCSIDAFWLFASFFLTVAGAVRSEHAVFRRVIPSIWLLGTAAVLVADVVASIQYGLDLGKVLNAPDKPMLALLENVDEASDLYTFLKGIPSSQAIVPPVALLVTVSRGGVLWLLNLMFFIAVATTSFKKQRKNPAAAVVLAPRVHSPQHATSANDKRHSDFSWQSNYGGGKQNPAYDRSADDDAHFAKQNRRKPRDADMLAAETRRGSSDALRNQRPWSYLDPQAGGELPRSRPRTPPAEEWQFSTPQSTLRLPRATLEHQHPSAPQPPYNQQFYHYPYPEQGSRYLDQAGQNYYQHRK